MTPRLGGRGLGVTGVAMTGRADGRVTFQPQLHD